MQKYKAKKSFFTDNLDKWYRILEGEIVCYDHMMKRIFNMTEQFYIPFYLGKCINLKDPNNFELIK
jgi:hypothetical protein